MLIAMSKNLLEMPANFETAFGNSKERASTTSCHNTKQSIKSLSEREREREREREVFQKEQLNCEVERIHDPNNNMFKHSIESLLSHFRTYKRFLSKLQLDGTY